MTQHGVSIGDDTLSWVANALIAHASKVGLNARDEANLVADTFDSRRGEASASLEARDLPLIKRGLMIGRHALVLGLLPETSEERELIGTMRQHRNQCVVSRSTLQPNAVLDLLLIMVGPRGSEGKDNWRTIALSVERDDRVVRKLVWLRPDDSRADLNSFDAFIKRTFLARPWTTNAQFSLANLDDMAGLVDESEVPRSTAGRWNRLAVEKAGNPDALVEGIVEIWAGRSAT